MAHCICQVLGQQTLHTPVYMTLFGSRRADVRRTVDAIQRGVKSILYKVERTTSAVLTREEWTAA